MVLFAHEDGGLARTKRRGQFDLAASAPGRSHWQVRRRKAAIAPARPSC
jgi:hypothetical protein